MNTPRKIALLIEYDGTAFSGWQWQPHARSVQQTIEDALHDLTGETCRLTAAGRTDAGVHARGQVAAFSTTRPWPAGAFQGALKSRLPEDVGILRVWEAPPDFNPRLHAIRRIYSYRLWNRPVAPVLDRNQWAHYPMPLDMARIIEASKRFPGVHDFKGFRSAQCGAKRTRLTLDRLEWRPATPKVSDWSDMSDLSDHSTAAAPLTPNASSPGLWIMEIAARSFLHNMVRVIVGTLLEIGRGAMPPERIDEVFATGDRTLAGPTAKPQGLTLERVDYPPNFPFRIPPGALAGTPESDS